MSNDNPTQQQFKLVQAVGGGEDEYGPFELIPLSMVKGGKLEDFKVHTRPMRHIINDSSPTPRGWYKDKHEPKNRRPRPCYTEALLTTPYGGFCPVGCKFSLLADTMVSTPTGYKAIQDFEAGDLVVGRNAYGTTIAKVLAPMSHEARGYWMVTLSNGRVLRATNDHPMYVPDHGWKALGECHEKERLESLQTLRWNVHISDEGPKIVRRMSQGALQERSASCYSSQRSAPQASDAGMQILRQPNPEALETSVRCSCMHNASQEGCACSGQELQGQALEVVSTDQTAPKPGHDKTQPEWNESTFLGIMQALRVLGGWDGATLSFSLGSQDSSVDGDPGLVLGVRDKFVCVRRWAGISAGLLCVREWGADQYGRSEGLHGAGCCEETGNVQARSGDYGHTAGNMGGGNADIIECSVGEPMTIDLMEWVDNPITVYDIQTTTENFYAEGALVHNCYVDHGTRGYRSTGLPTANPNYPDAMRKQVAQIMVSGAAYISSFTEPFHHLENTYHVTQRLSQVFVDNNLPIFYLSRRHVPDWAIDNLLANPYSYMQWSVNTSNPKVFRHLSPGALKLDDWLKYADKLSDLGIYISVQCNPVLPGIVTMDDLINLVQLGAQAGVRHFIFKFVEQVFNNRKLLLDRLANVPGVWELDNLLTQTIGGVYTIRQDVRMEWLTALLAATRAAGVTMSLCYEYFEDGAAGANLAPWFTTSDQCHGRGVPIHYRPEPGAKFQPLSGCYRKGCLYCAEHGTQACHNETLLEAKALQYKDLRSIIIDEPSCGWELPESCARPEDAWKSIYGNPDLKTDAEMWGL